ncbi:TolB family protein [Larkinella rosea]|uniref:Uncharacterized protein n=1 Tax=Larkinella rosea TaxID=2025312 RepID=A0A3P1BZC8_9BACT|nr:PD40 domain-containing protein [Larkinella rosea]RRB06328.1 hypothetical protein EHT25_00540 [Larkinella rosea]
MKMSLVPILLLSCLLMGCPFIYTERTINFKTASLPTEPTNFSELNTYWNDYNSAGPPTLGAGMNFYFSSDRSNTFRPDVKQSFDIMDYRVTISFDQTSGKWYRRADRLSGGPETYGYMPPKTYIGNFDFHLFRRINTGGNELGPFVRTYKNPERELFMYASDSTGNLDVYGVFYTPYHTASHAYEGDGPFKVNLINSAQQDAYPTLTESGDQLLFTSDRSGSFDLFAVPVSPENLVASLQSRPEAAARPEPIAVLNSPADDKCPYINGPLLVFTSNRPGGFGGFDLYYSRWENGTWSAPINFGPTINTSSDEYRPVAMRAEQFENDLLLFSSNRPGGAGGFDLYYVGISKELLQNPKGN